MSADERTTLDELEEIAAWWEALAECRTAASMLRAAAPGVPDGWLTQADRDSIDRRAVAFLELVSPMFDEEPSDPVIVREADGERTLLVDSLTFTPPIAFALAGRALHHRVPELLAGDTSNLPAELTLVQLAEPLGTLLSIALRGARIANLKLVSEGTKKGKR